MPFYNFKAPNLPLARNVYDRQQQDLFANALRLYFNRLDDSLLRLANPRGAALLNVPCALYYSTTTQTAAAINTAYEFEFENTYFENVMTINGGSNTQITVDNPGIYNFQFTGILVSGSASPKDAWIWIRRNGTDIGYSGIPITSDINSGHTDMQWNFNIDVEAGSYIEIMWATDDTDLYFDAEAPSSPYPGHSSGVMAVNFISNLEGFTVAAAP